MPQTKSRKPFLHVSDLLTLNKTFRKSVQLVHDYHDASSTDDFVVTEFIRECFGRMSEAFQLNSTQRAWRITGDYGSGKSAFALNLLKAACGRHKEVSRNLQLKPSPGLTSVIVEGDRESLVTSIGNALITQVPGLEDSRTPRSNDGLMRLLKKAIEQTEGIFLVIDEMGKNLEYAMMNPDNSDVYILQKLAELADRSGEKPLVLVAILHLGLSSYCADIDSTSRKEWEKVAGRFQEVTYQHPFEQTVQLCSSALNVNYSGLPKRMIKQAEDSMAWCVDQGIFGHSSKEFLVGKATGIFPLHPTVLTPLNALLKRFGQNERSLFGFLARNEPDALHSVMGVKMDNASFYGVHHLYSYIRTNIAPAMTNGKSTHWRVIESVVRQANNRLEEIILQAVGVLNLLEVDSMSATKEMIIHMLKHSQEVKVNGIAPAIKELQKHHLLFERGSRRGYALWPHSSVHLDDEFEKAMGELGEPSEPSEPTRMVASLLKPQQIVARRHYIETGNLRHFELQFLPSSDLEEFLKKGPKAQLGEADGFVTVFLPRNQRAYKEALAVMGSEHEKLSSSAVCAIAKPPVDLLGTAKDVQAWKNVGATVKALASDEYARKELQRQLLTSETRLEELVLNFVGEDINSPNLAWFNQTGAIEDNKLTISKRLSELCDLVYPECPRINNELINRRISSSAGSRARTALIDHMATSPSDAYLGMDQSKNPPEMSIYLSILQAGKIHVKDESNPGKWKIQIPKRKKSDPCRLRPSLKAIEKMLKEHEGRRVSLDKIIECLTKSPIGARQGLIPLILAIYIDATTHSIAVYEDSTYIHSVGADEIQRMAKEPECFELQYCAVEGVRAEVFNSLAEVFGLQVTKNPAVLDVVRPLMHFISNVPEYARNTKKLKPASKDLRQALLNARDPSALIFEKIPSIIQAGGNHSNIGKQLAVLISDIQASYNRLLDRMAQSITDSFGANISIDKFRTELQQRSSILSRELTDSDLRSFVLRVGDNKLDFRQWLESLANHLARKSASRWHDQDEEIYHQKLAAMAKRMLRAEAANADISRHGLIKDQERVVRITLTKPDGSDHAELLHWGEDEEDKVNELEKKILKSIKQNGRAGLGATAKALWAQLKNK